MNNLNFLCLIANCIFFVSIFFTNSAFSQQTAVFNPNANEFKGKVVIARTFATWCRYCRQQAIKDAIQKQTPPFEENMKMSDKSINLFLVPTENYEESAQFLDDIGFKAKIQIVNPKQLVNWGVNNFGAVLIFNDTQLVKMLDGEIDIISKEVD